ncbi:MAG: transcription termination/antitermination protein NusG [Desulfobacca sp. 4484_104]|nr:MAG: transcription termination/antitermination protein NusG [Desulfobacca sp. 4484_104]RLA88446.1 MAG: transcription termination/antitermination protein NusG [Deltaproteobacteria bacterium]
MSQKWYIVHTYSGFEKHVKQSLEERARAQRMEHLITEVLVPTEQVEEIVKGEKRISARKFYPGYIMVRMELNDDTWHLVNDTPKVTGFLGSRTEPVAIPESEAEKILTQMREGALKPKPKIKFEVGDKVRVIDGPFSNFNGLVDEVKAEKGRVRVMISVFGRSTPVEFEFSQLEKI